MLPTIKLLLPALLPSWRFFDAVGPSPRIEFRLMTRPDADTPWQPFRPRPARLGPAQMARRLVWNPLWNETLFMVSCAERLLHHPTHHSLHEIQRRIAATLPPDPALPYLQIRLALISRHGAQITRDIAYTSPLLPR